MFQAIFCDLDGTLLNSKSELSKGSIEIIKKLNDKGISIILISGRHDYEMFQFAALLELGKHKNNYLISSDGVYVEKLGYGVINSPGYVNAEHIKLICSHFKRDGQITFITKGKDYTVFGIFLLLKFIIYRRNFSRTKFVFIKKKNINNVEKIVISTHKSALIYDRIKQFLKSDISVQNNGLYKVEVLNSKSTKLNAAKIVLEDLQIAQEKCLYFGDEGNDLECLAFFSNSYAMSNGIELAKKTAKKICVSNDEDGVYKTLKELELENEL